MIKSYTIMRKWRLILIQLYSQMSLTFIKRIKRGIKSKKNVKYALDMCISPKN